MLQYVIDILGDLHITIHDFLQLDPTNSIFLNSIRERIFWDLNEVMVLRLNFILTYYKESTH